MAEEGFNDQNNKSHPDRDFGLPKVEIKPIEPSVELTQGEVAPGPESISPGEPVVPANAAAPGAEAALSGQKPEEKENKFSWAIVLVVLLAFGLAAWFYYSRNAEPITDQSVDTVVKIEKPVPEPPAPKKEVVVPVESAAKVSLTTIQSRAEKARYFVVVGSFVDEDMARDFSRELNQKDISTYLVYPYGDIVFFRLAIGQFETFGLAVEEINRVKDGFDGNLWVLKY